uniref:Uncharacterized protein n=1 Tax=Oryza punctata TaxID=4537 RepID=A0A0E0KVY4_ORYPU
MDGMVMAKSLQQSVACPCCVGHHYRACLHCCPDRIHSIVLCQATTITVSGVVVVVPCFFGDLSTSESGFFLVSVNDLNRNVDMNALVNSMTNELDYYWSLGEVPDNGKNSCIIYKIQQHIRMVDKLAYEPCMLSIGPYHHGAPALQAMQKEKWSYLDYILNLNSSKTLMDYLCPLDDISNTARNCYSEEIKMDEKTYVDNLNSEETLVGNGGQNRSCPDDVSETKKTNNRILNQEGSQSCKLEEIQRAQYDDEIGQWFFKFVHHDLFLLENQIPFFVVKKIFNLLAGDNIWLTHEISMFV